METSIAWSADTDAQATHCTLQPKLPLTAIYYKSLLFTLNDKNIFLLVTFYTELIIFLNIFPLQSTTKILTKTNLKLVIVPILNHYNLRHKSAVWLTHLNA